MNRCKITHKYLILCLLACLCACHKSEYRSEEGVVWHTSYHIIYDSPVSLADSLSRVMNSVDAILSPFNSASLVSRLNEGDSVKACPMLSDVYLKAREIWKKSGGRYDPSASPLINAWGFGYKKGQDPDSAEIASILRYVGMGKSYTNEGWIIKTHPKMEFNFSSLAKGYGCDFVGEMLQRQGCRNFMVEIGGEIVLRGVNPAGGNWRIAIDRPVEDTTGSLHEAQLILSLTDAAVATSGNYRNFRESKGGKMGHIVNPKSGYPFQGEIVSATVVAADCMDADAWATALMASPIAEAKQMAMRENLAVYLILTDGSVWSSPQFSKYIDR